jgi:hypothetical protein
MNKKYLLLVSMIAALCMSSWGKEPYAQVLGKSFYWQAPSLMLDTIGWTSVEQSLLNVPDSTDKNPQGGCETFTKNKKAIFRLKKPSALSLVILTDLGYDVIFLTQWSGSISSLLQVPIPGIDDFKGQRLLTDLQWETIERYTIDKPNEVQDDYTIKLFFRNGGVSFYKGRENVYQSEEQLTGITDGIVVKLSNGSGLDVLLRRYVFNIYLITPADKTASKLISEIEKSMDGLKLDLSYKAPEILEVKCK